MDILIILIMKRLVFVGLFISDCWVWLGQGNACVPIDSLRKVVYKLI